MTCLEGLCIFGCRGGQFVHPSCCVFMYVQARALMAAHAKPQIVRQLLVLVNELTNLGTATPPPDATQ